MIPTNVIVTQESQHITVRGTRSPDNEAVKRTIGGRIRLTIRRGEAGAGIKQ